MANERSKSIRRRSSRTRGCAPPNFVGGVAEGGGDGRAGPSSAQFGSWDGAVHLRTAKLLDRLSSDCSAVFSARAAASAAAAASSSGGGGGGYSSGSTYWIPRGAVPRCLLEQLACAILEAHLPPELEAAASSPSPPGGGGSGDVGAEWWTLSIDAEDDSIGFHWDLDYDAEERLRVHRTPHAGTVTYLCDAGAPTLVLDKAPPKASRDGPPEDGRPIGRGWISAPRAGKHVRFQGSWLHGAPDLGDVLTVRGDSNGENRPNGEEEATSRRGRGGGSGGGGGGTKRGKGTAATAPRKSRGNKRPKRVSLLVNVWLDGAPGLAAPLPEHVAARLSPCLARVPFSLVWPSPLLSPAEAEAPRGKRGGGGGRKRPGKREFSWPVANLAEDVSCSVCVQMPRSIEMPAGGTAELTFRAGEAVLLF